MADKSARAVISVSTSWDDRAVIQAEADRTGQPLNVTMMRLAMLGLEHQARTAEGKAAGMDQPRLAAGRDAPIPLLTIGPVATSTTSIVVAPVPNEIAPVTLPQPTPEPTVIGAVATPRQQGRTPRWIGMETVASIPSSERARWSAVGILSVLLVGMLVPGDGLAAAAVSQIVLGQPGDGIAASNQLFKRFSNRAGPLRYLEATTRLTDNRARVRACADRADRLADYRNLTVCEIHMPSRKRAIEVGQGIVD